MREYYMQLQLHIEPIISMEEVLLNCMSYEKVLRNITSLFPFISFSGEQQYYRKKSFLFHFFLTELQDLSFDVITESASSSVFVFTCVYRQRYHKKTFL